MGAEGILVGLYLKIPVGSLEPQYNDDVTFRGISILSGNSHKLISARQLHK